MGGTFRDRVQAYVTGFYHFDSDDIVRDLCQEAERHMSDGFQALKIKIGFGIDLDIKLIRAVRKTVGDDIRLMADANHAYDANTAIKVGRALEDENYYWFEEPVPPEDLSGYREVRAALDIAIAGGEAEFTRFGARHLINGRLVDILQPDCDAVGGLTEAKRIIMMANAENIRSMPHVWGTFVATAAALQLLASMPSTPPSLHPDEPMLEFDRSAHPLREVILNEPIVVKGGYVDIPKTSGLGVTLNRDYLSRYKVA